MGGRLRGYEEVRMEGEGLKRMEELVKSTVETGIFLS